MKPLELTVYPLLAKVGRLAERGYIVNKRPVAAWYVDNYQIFEKRMTGPELAAEWHKQDNHCGQRLEGYGVAHSGEPLGTEEVEVERLASLYRFATLPHYDKADS